MGLEEGDVVGEGVADPLQRGQLVQQLRPLEVDGLADLGLGVGDGPFPVGPSLRREALGFGLGLGHLAARGLLGLGHCRIGGALGQEQGALDRLVALDVGPGAFLRLPGPLLGLVQLGGGLAQAGLGLTDPDLDLLAECVHVIDVVAPPLPAEFDTA